MPFLFRRCLAGSVLFAGLLSAQAPLLLKTRVVATDSAVVVSQIAPGTSGRVHLLIQFSAPPPPQSVRALTARGVRVLGDVPANGLLVSVSRPVDISEEMPGRS